MIDINELRKLAQAATPGPWKMLPVGDGMPRFAIADGDYLSILTIVEEGGCTFGVVYEDSDARYISAANPAAISEILDRLEAAEKERDRYKLAYDEWIAKTEWLQHEIACSSLPAKYLGMHRAEAIKLEVDRLRAKIEAMEQQEPAGTLHDDGYFVWRRGCRPYESNYVGWMMKLYALPGAKGE